MEGGLKPGHATINTSHHRLHGTGCAQHTALFISGREAVGDGAACFGTRCGLASCCQQLPVLQCLTAACRCHIHTAARFKCCILPTKTEVVQRVSTDRFASINSSVTTCTCLQDTMIG